jgi:hypothetical protein
MEIKMNESGLFLSIPFFAKLSPATRDEIMTQMGLGSPTTAIPAPDAFSGVTHDAAIDSEGPAELTGALVRKLTDHLSPKTLGALRLIAKSDLPEIRMSDAIASTEGAESYLDMKGVWSALTRRTRTILGDKNADLIWWNNPQYDADGSYVDNVGRVAPLTHQSLRAYFSAKG